jgi:hypothetical protein
MIDFTYWVPGGGYNWVRAKGYLTGHTEGRTVLRPDSRLEDEARWYLTPAVGSGGAPPIAARSYKPLKVTGLYREFAAIREADRGAILAFANERGRLGPGVSRFLDVANPDEPNSLSVMTGESHEDWAGEIKAMRRAVVVWDALFKRDRAALEQSGIRWQSAIPDTGSGFHRKACWIYFGPDNYQQHLFDSEDPSLYDGALTAATLLLNDWINTRLDFHVQARLFHDFQGQTSVAYPRSSFRLHPRNLLGCLWLQLAQAVAGNKETRTCEGCKSWFEVSPDRDGRTARRLFCTPQCKLREHRRTKQTALRLYGEGKSAKLIAEVLGKDEATVRGWLPARRRKLK